MNQKNTIINFFKLFRYFAERSTKWVERFMFGCETLMFHFERWMIPNRKMNVSFGIMDDLIQNIDVSLGIIHEPFQNTNVSLRNINDTTLNIYDSKKFIDTTKKFNDTVKVSFGENQRIISCK